MPEASAKAESTNEPESEVDPDVNVIAAGVALSAGTGRNVFASRTRGVTVTVAAPRGAADSAYENVYVLGALLVVYIIVSPNTNGGALV